MPRRFLQFLLIVATTHGAALAEGFAQTNGETKVVSHVYNNYTRVRLADGSFKPETFSFVDGGVYDEDPIAGDSVNRITFEEVAKVVAEALRSQRFVSSSDPQSTEHMIMLWYGKTKPTVDKPTNYELVERTNARILGFQQEFSKADSLYFTSFARDFYDEFRVARYFVVLKAYDFQVAQKEKRLKLLWESRFSIQRHAVDFTEQLPQMAQFAARTFGQETNGIFNPNLIKGSVKMDEIKILGAEGR
jgi:hypothetical protein